MDLNAALAKGAFFGRCTPDDEPALHRILEASPMRVGGMELCYDRRPSFNDYLRYLSENYVTLIGTRDGIVRAFASFSWGPRLVNGAPTSAVYVGDFRSQFDRRLSGGWRKLYPDLIDVFHTSPALGPSPWAYTAILKNNVPAYRALVENRPGKKFFYHSIGERTMVNCFFRLPSRRPIAHGLQLVTGRDVGEVALREFMTRVNATLFLGYRFDHAPGNEWDRRQKVWPGFRLEDFMVLVDGERRIKACTLPWSPEAKKIRLQKATRLTALSYQLLSLAGLRVPKVGQTLNTLYLSHLYHCDSLSVSEQADTVAMFLHAIYRTGRAKNFHMVSYCDPGRLRFAKSLRAYYSQTIGVELFVVTTTAERPAIPIQHGVGFEMSLA